MFSPTITSTGPVTSTFSNTFTLGIFGTNQTTSNVLAYFKSGSTFTNTGTFSDYPTGAVTTLAISPDNTLLAVGFSGGDRLYLYSISGTTFTRLTSNIDSLPTSDPIKVTFSPNGSYLFVGTSTELLVYVKSGNNFTKQTPPLSSDSYNDIVFTPDSGYVGLATNNAPYLGIYSFVNGTLTLITNTDHIPTRSVTKMAINSAGTMVSVVYPGTSPNVNNYTMSNGVLTNIATLGFTNPNTVAFAKSNTYWAIAVNQSPYLFTYSISGTTFTLMNNPVSAPPYQVFEINPIGT